MPRKLPKLAAWVPLPVAREWAALRADLMNEGAPAEHFEAHDRILFGSGMEQVWKTLAKLDPLASWRPVPLDLIVTPTAEERQGNAMAHVLTVAVAIIRRDVRALPPAVVGPVRREMLEAARDLRRIAKRLKGWRMQAEADASNDTADELERRVAKLTPGAGLLLVDRAGDDDQARGVLLVLEETLHEVYGDRMHGTAAALAAVILDRDHVEPRRPPRKRTGSPRPHHESKGSAARRP